MKAEMINLILFLCPIPLIAANISSSQSNYRNGKFYPQIHSIGEFARPSHVRPMGVWLPRHGLLHRNGMPKCLYDPRRFPWVPRLFRSYRDPYYGDVYVHHRLCEPCRGLFRVCDGDRGGYPHLRIRAHTMPDGWCLIRRRGRIFRLPGF